MTNTNSLTQAILLYVNHNGFKAWRNNNSAIYSVKQKTFRKNPATLHGVSDIIGYNRKTGVALYVEVKTGKDKLSDAQERFLTDAELAGCLVFVARDFDSFEKEFNLKIKSC